MKTRVVLETAERLYRSDRIRGLLVVAPDGVEDAWLREQAQEHLGPEMADPAGLLRWETRRSKTKAQAAALAGLIDRPGFTVLAMTYDALRTDAGALAARAYLEAQPRLYVADESSRIKTPSAQITKRAILSGSFAPYRRVLNGTPIADSPFECYSQVRFVDPTFWVREVGCRLFSDFKVIFGEWEVGRAAGGREFPAFVRYRNQALLGRLLEKIGSRRLLRETVDLPPLVREKRRFDLSPEQRRVYRQLQNEYRADLGSGSEVTASLAIVRLTRFRQIASGYVPTDFEPDEDGNQKRRMVLIGEDRPRLRALVDLLGDLPGQAIIWAQYDQDVDSIVAQIEGAVRYDGRTPKAERPGILDRFRAGSIRYLVSKPRCAGYGLNLAFVSNMVYYNDGFSMADRLQSTARIERPGQKAASILCVDLVARDTVDERIEEVQRMKSGTSDEVLTVFRREMQEVGT